MWFAAHSGLRYLVLAAGALALLHALVGWAARREYSPVTARLAAAFAGLLHLQVVLGFAVLFARPFSSALIGHVFATLAAAAVVQFVNTTMKRREAARRSYGPHAVSVAIALALVAMGVAAIGRGVLESTL